jgi:LysM repeat protein
MTREAKIGMLTGLFVIVLIGVLLSEYISGNPAANNRMAALPQFGDSYRRQALDPVGVPGAARADTAGILPKAYATDREGNRLAASTPGMPVLVSDPGMAGSAAPAPAPLQPVQPVPAGPVMLEAGKPSIPVIETVDGAKGQPAIYVAVGDTPPAVGGLVGPGAALVVDKSGTVKAVAKAAPKGEEYTIVKGDTLQKIAKKVYKSSGKEDLHRIIAANPASLKDESSTLMIGKKLLIPAAPLAATPARSETPVLIKAPGSDPAKAPDVSKRDAMVVIRPPGVGDKADSVKKDADTPAVATKTDKKSDAAADIYIVQKGDTLEKIAKKLSPAAYKSVMDKIAKLNDMKDKDELQVGEKLKIPSKKV